MCGLGGVWEEVRCECGLWWLVGWWSGEVFLRFNISVVWIFPLVVCLGFFEAVLGGFLCG